jgi:rhodanese-related sulfurtransferase
MVRPVKQRKIFTGLCVFVLVLASQSFAGTDVRTIDTAQLHSMIVDNAYSLEAGREKHFTVIDARTKEEYDEAHIFSAISIPAKDVEKSLGLLPMDNSAPLVVYDDDAKLETRKWAEQATSAGYTNIVIYADSFSTWKEKHSPVSPFTSGR